MFSLAVLIGRGLDHNQAAKEYFGLKSVLLLSFLSLLCSVFRVFAQRSQSGLIETFCDTEFGLFVYYDRESRLMY